MASVDIRARLDEEDDDVGMLPCRRIMQGVFPKSSKALMS